MAYTDYEVEDYVAAAWDRIVSTCVLTGDSEPHPYVKSELRAMFEAGRQWEREICVGPDPAPERPHSPWTLKT